MPAALPPQSSALLGAAREIVKSGVADAVLLLTETNLHWDDVLKKLDGVRLIVAAESEALADRIRNDIRLDVIDLDPQPVPSKEKLSVALLAAVAAQKVDQGSHLVAVYNGIASGDRPEPIDSLSLIHLDDHLERLTASDLRKLGTDVPIETLRLTIDLASQIGREGREGSPVGTILIVGDTRRVLSMSRPSNFNPFRGYSKEERDLRDRSVREQIKEIATLDGAIVIGKDGIAVAACVLLDVSADGVKLAKGFGARHKTAAAVSLKTDAIALCVSQSSGTVRVFQKGEVVLHIEPLARPHVWQPFRLDTKDDEETVED